MLFIIAADRLTRDKVKRKQKEKMQKKMIMKYEGQR